MANPLTFHLPVVSDIKVRNALYFYPDVLDYQFNKTQYQNEWARLHQDKGGYLIVKHGQLDRVGWLRYSFERVKGWFGFNNNCLPTKVIMAAQKLAYFGYLNEFNQDTVLDAINGWGNQYHPEKSFIDSCKKIRNDIDSANLQQQLVTFYRKYAHQLNAVNTSHLHLPLPHSHHWFIFGHTYAMNGNFADMLHLDVQDEGLINSYLPSLVNGNDTLVGSTCRRLYIDRKLKEIDKTLCKFEQKPVEVEAAGLWGLVGKYLYQQPKPYPKPYPTELAGLNTEAEITLALWPELEAKYADILIRLKLVLGHQLKEVGELPRMKNLYQDAYRMINTHGASYLYLQHHFLAEEAFALLDVNSPLVQSWGEYLLHKILPNNLSPEKNHLYKYRIAQIRPDLIPNGSLATYIDGCLKEKNYLLAFKLINRLAESKIDLAAQYLLDNRANLHDFVTQDTPLLSEAYSKKIVANRKAPSARVASFFSSATNDSEYELAVSKHPSVEYCDAAPYYLKKYVKEYKWEKARALLINREKNGLGILELPQEAITSLAQHYTDEGNRLYGEGKVLREENHHEEAVMRYSESLSMMEVAEQVMPSDEHRYNLNVHRRLLAGIIIDRKSLTLDHVDKALTYLEDIEKTSCPKKDEFLNEVYIKALEHRVQFLHESCLGAAYGQFKRATEDHTRSCLESIIALGKSLNKLISLREDYTAGDDKVANRTRLAALHFLKAEFIFYFQVGKKDSIERDQMAFSHYAKACEIEPNQPFYHLSYYKNLPFEQLALATKANKTGLSLLDQCGSTHSQFTQWFEERWQHAADRIYNVEMPTPVATPTSRSWNLF